MKFDIVFVTYNSENWIDNCIKSIIGAEYDKKNISLFFYDNNSSDNTIDKLEKIKEKYNKEFNGFRITFYKGRVT